MISLNPNESSFINDMYKLNNVWIYGIAYWNLKCKDDNSKDYILTDETSECISFNFLWFRKKALSYLSIPIAWQKVMNILRAWWDLFAIKMKNFFENNVNKQLYVFELSNLGCYLKHCHLYSD